MIEFDPEKDAINRRKHGFSLAAAAPIFDELFIETVDARYDYGETRFQVLGVLGGEQADRVFVVVYTWRSGVRRILSFRKANDRETRQYRNRHA